MVGGIFGFFAFLVLAVRAAVSARRQPDRRRAWRREAVLFAALALVMAAAVAAPFLLRR